MYFDTHAHLTAPDYSDDLQGILLRADEAEVTWILSASVSVADSVRNIDIARAHPRVVCAAGVHPEESGRVEAGWEAELDALLGRKVAVAVGECGLDAWHPDPPIEKQVPVFRAQVRLAAKHRLPLVVHSRKAVPETLRIIREEGGGGVGGVFHCVEGDEVLAREILSAGFHVGVGGTSTYPRNESLRAMLTRLPRERILLETDAPWLAPQAHRGKRNEPAFVTEVAGVVAAAWGTRVEEVARTTRENAMRLFMPGPRKPAIAYDFRGNIYLNMTTRCTAHCAFCSRETTADFRGLNLKLAESDEPTPVELLQAVGDPGKWGEVVFCGYGEPTIRLAELVETAGKVKAAGGRTRLNTNGHGSLFHGRDIVPDLAGVIDTVSVSLDAPTEAQYLKLVRPDAGPAAWKAMHDFIRSCVGKIPRVVASVVAVPGVDLVECEKLARSLGAEFQARAFFQ